MKVCTHEWQRYVNVNGRRKKLCIKCGVKRFLSFHQRRQTHMVRARDRFRCGFCGRRAKIVHHLLGWQYRKITAYTTSCKLHHKLADSHQLPLFFVLKIPYLLLKNMAKAKFYAIKNKKGKTLFNHLFKHWWK